MTVETRTPADAVASVGRAGVGRAGVGRAGVGRAGRITRVGRVGGGPGDGDDPFRWAVRAICFSAVLASIYMVASGGPVTFAVEGRIKAVLLPLTFGIIVWAVVAKTRTGSSAWPGSMLWVPTLAALMLAGVVSAELHSQKTSIVATGQDLVIFAALGIGALAARPVRPDEMHEITISIWWTAAVMSLLGAAVGPFAALGIPALVGSLISWRTLTSRQRLIPCVLVIGVVRDLHAEYQLSDYFSGARTSEFVACAGVLVLYAWMRRRPSFISMVALTLVAATCALSWVQPAKELIGRQTPTDDITIQQREYEMHRVLLENGQSVGSTLLGAGMGGTVDLSMSPDTATLVAAGRKLTAVDDAHLLVTHILLKFGWLGILWLTLLMLCYLRLIHDVAQLPRAGVDAGAGAGAGAGGNDGAGAVPGAHPGLGLLLVLSGFIAYGLPAATNFLGNPLYGLLFATLALTAAPFRRERGYPPDLPPIRIAVRPSAGPDHDPDRR